jgi:type II secretory pathway pseudopilin PulG
MVEVLVALALLSLAIPMVAGFSTTSKKAQVATNEMENATASAQAVIDSLSLLPACVIAAGNPKATTIQGPFRTYSASWTYTPRGSHSGLLAVTVSWSQAGAVHTVQVSSEAP